MKQKGNHDKETWELKQWGNFWAKYSVDVLDSRKVASKKSYWFQVSTTKLLGDYSGNIKMSNVNKFRKDTVLACYSVLFKKKRLWRNEAFSSILSNLPKQKLAFMKLSYLTLSWRRSLSHRNQSIDFLYDRDLRNERVKKKLITNLIICDRCFKKWYSQIYLDTKLHLKQIILKNYCKSVKKGYSQCMTAKKLTSPSRQRASLSKGCLSKNRKNDYHHWILHIQISLATKFHFK